jgi:hypothetical protein
MSQKVTLSTRNSAAQGVSGPLLDGAELSDDRGVADGELSRRARIDLALPHPVYTSVQMLEKRPQNCHFRHFLGSSARLTGGTVRSATRCSITRSDMICARPGQPSTECVWVHRNCHTEFR